MCVSYILHLHQLSSSHQHCIRTHPRSLPANLYLQTNRLLENHIWIIGLITSYPSNNHKHCCCILGRQTQDPSNSSWSQALLNTLVISNSNLLASLVSARRTLESLGWLWGPLNLGRQAAIGLYRQGFKFMAPSMMERMSDSKQHQGYLTSDSQSCKTTDTTLTNQMKLNLLNKGFS